jgi:hypothetical protein
MEDLSEPQEQYPVSVWEGIAIVGGAILLVAAGLAGLGVKALGNAFDSQRAEAIAQSLMTYDIAGGSRGLFGANIGGGKMAVISSVATVAPAQAQAVSQLPAVELFLARMPLPEETETEGEPTPSPEAENQLFSGFSFSYQDPAAFQISMSQVEQKLFCGEVTPVEIQQGALTVVEDAAPVPAIKYEVKRVLDADSQIVTISALGDRAAERAAEVFDSLVCVTVP